MNCSFDSLAMMKTEQEESHSVRVLLVDDSSSALHELETALSKQNRIMVVGTACSEIDAQAAVQICQPNVVVLEMLVGRMSGINICRTLRQKHPNIAVLFFTAKDDASLLRSAINAGAQGYLLKSASCEALLKTIEAIAIGRVVIDPSLTSQVFTWIRERKRVTPRWSMANSSVEDLKFHVYVPS